VSFTGLQNATARGHRQNEINAISIVLAENASEPDELIVGSKKPW
jgi:hypothetical protein